MQSKEDIFESWGLKQTKTQPNREAKQNNPSIMEPSPTPSTTAVSSSTTTATTKAITATEVKSQFPMPDQSQPPTPSTDPSTTDLVDLRSQNLSPASKLPSRPRKLRKLSPETSTPSTSKTTKSPSSTTTTTTTTTNNNRMMVVSQGRVPRLVPRSLSTEGEIDIALRHLRNADPHLARLIDLHQPPTFDSFQTPFLALTKSILYQQLAYKAGTSIYSRFVALCGGENGVIPENLLALTPQQLRQIGVSGRKTSYLHDLARKYQNGILSDSAIINMDDKSLFTMLTMVNGIGSWSVHMFMIFSLHRPDVLPVNDLGVRKGVQLLYGLEDLPRPSQMDQLCEKWRPYRSVASWYLWRFVEAKGAPSTSAAVTAAGSMKLQQQQQEPQQQPQQQQMQPPALNTTSHQQLQPQFLDPINSIMNLGSNFSQLS